MPNEHRSRLPIGAVAAVVLGLALPAAARVQEASEMSQPLRLAPGLTLEGADGGALPLSEYAGKRVLLVTWASW